MANPKPISTLQVVSASISLFKSLIVITAMMLLEWSRIKRRKAEDEAAVASTELDVLKAQTALKEASNAKDPGTIVDEYLDRATRPRSP